jgi:hypothetical protein
MANVSGSYSSSPSSLARSKKFEGRKLLVVAGHDELRASIDGSDGVTRTNLGCLIEDHHVKTK